jgi:CxxC motif-containing protein (DUF1111 family)
MRNLLALAVAGTLSIAAVAIALGEPRDTRSELAALPQDGPLGGDTTRPLTSGDAFSFEAPNAPREHQRPFSFGNRLFNTNWVQAPGSVKSFDGLGPLFNRVSCSGCHTKDGRGQPPPSGEGPMDSMLFRISVPGSGPHGEPKGLEAYGDQLSERAIPGVLPEGRAHISYEEITGHYVDGEAYALRKPSYAIVEAAYGPLPKDLMISPRVAPQMIGLGLLEAVPPADLEALADPTDKDGDGISGKVNHVWDSEHGTKAIGRFGWKAGQPSLMDQNAGAAIGDIGLTSDIHDTQNCTTAQLTCLQAIDEGSPELSRAFLDKLTLYTRSLAVPAQRNADAAVVSHGAEVFRSFGCTSCHQPTLRSQDAALPELSHQIFHPYTDLLLHDMGGELADGRPEFEADGREWRTPPLWGLGLVPTVNGHNTLLHDGRARGFAEAVLWHGGEAENAREKFRTAPKSEREALIAFLQSL